jgi:nucleoid DNA-binding protein
VTKADIVDQIAEETGLTKTDTAAIVEGFLSAVTQALVNEDHIEIRGFGTFKVVRRAPRTGRNPKTGEAVRIPSRPVPVFKPSRELRIRVEKGK